MSHPTHNHPCGCSTSPGSVLQQTLPEMEFERGIWGAAQSGELERVRVLLAKGTDPNRCDHSGYTALHYAARNGYLEVCKILLQQGANINATTRAGMATALHRAATAGQASIVQLLLSRGARVDMQDADGKNALHRAAERGHRDVFSMLCCDVLQCCKDNKGKLPSDYLKTD